MERSGEMSLSLVAWRRARQISQKSMAEILGVHINTYQNWENRPGKISIENARLISKVLNVPLDDIDFTSKE
jgi:transcriptional regulator with XRE-family HTH domain